MAQCLPSSTLVLPLPLAATHLHAPHPPGAVVFAMLCAQQCLTQVGPLQLKQGRTWVIKHILFGHLVQWSAQHRSASTLMALEVGVVVRLW